MSYDSDYLLRKIPLLFLHLCVHSKDAKKALIGMLVQCQGSPIRQNTHVNFIAYFYNGLFNLEDSTTKGTAIKFYHNH